VLLVKNLGHLDFQMCMLLLVACYQVGKSYQSINQVQLIVEANCYAQFQYNCHKKNMQESVKALMLNNGGPLEATKVHTFQSHTQQCTNSC
jgi:hypothetical protein